MALLKISMKNPNIADRIGMWLILRAQGLKGINLKIDKGLEEDQKAGDQKLSQTLKENTRLYFQHQPQSISTSFLKRTHNKS